MSKTRKKPKLVQTRRNTTEANEAYIETVRAKLDLQNGSLALRLILNRAEKLGLLLGERQEAIWN